MDPLNARAAWSSVVGVLEHGERSQKNVVENIFEEFLAAVFDKRAISHLLQCGVDYMKPCRPTYGVAHVLKRQMPSLTSFAISKPSVRATK